MTSAGYTTNDMPGCPNGGLLEGIDGPDNLAGRKGDDEIRGLGNSGRSFDELHGGSGSDVLYRSDGADHSFGVEGEDVLYGEDSNELVVGRDEGVEDTQRDKLYCGLLETGAPCLSSYFPNSFSREAVHLSARPALTLPSRTG